MNHRLSIVDYAFTLGIVFVAVAICYNYLGTELVRLIETSFALLESATSSPVG